MKAKMKEVILNVLYNYPLIIVYAVGSIVVCIWMLANPVDIEMYSVITKTWAAAALILVALEARKHYIYTEDVDEEDDDKGYDKCA